MRQLRSRYRGSVLGFLWTLLVPLAMVVTFGFVFSYISRMDMKTFWPFFLGGFIPWTLFATAIGMSVTSVNAHAHFVTRIQAPKAVFPVAAFAMALVEAAALALSAVIVLALSGYQFQLSLAFLPVSVVILLPFVLGACLLLSAANVFFQDVAFIWTAGSTILFFCTPILYPLSSMPAAARPFFEANPLYPFVRIFQDPMLGSMPPADLVVTAALYSAIMLMLGTSVFSRSEKSFYLYL